MCARVFIMLVPLISIPVNCWIADSTAQEMLEKGKTTTSLIKLIVWGAILITALLIALYPNAE